MSKRSLMEESQLLHYAFIMTELVGMMSRYIRDKQLSSQDKDIIDKSLEFFNRAIDGQSLLSQVENKYAPDIESLEIYGYVTSALNSEYIKESDLEETLKERLPKSKLILELIKENKLTKKEFQNLGSVQSFFRSLAAVLVHESTILHQEEDGENLG